MTNTSGWSILRCGFRGRHHAMICIQQAAGIVIARLLVLALASSKNSRKFIFSSASPDLDFDCSPFAPFFSAWQSKFRTSDGRYKNCKTAQNCACLPAVRRYCKAMRAPAYRYLVNVPGVCGGKTIVEGTRIGVHDVVGLIVNGASIEDVARSFPGLTKAQIYESLAYYEDHR